MVPLGADGRLTLTNTSSGTAHLIVDVSAYFHEGKPSSPGTFSSVAPTRLLDTRLSSGPVAGGKSVSFMVGGKLGIPTNASAVVLNLTATQTASFGFLTAYAAGSLMPRASNVNYSAGQTVPNLVVVPVGTDGKVTVSNTSSGAAQVIADVAGYFLPGKPVQAGALRALYPTRFLDTRVSSGPVAAGGWSRYEAHALYTRAQSGDIPTKGAIMAFPGSIRDLTLLFMALAVDPFVGSAVLGGSGLPVRLADAPSPVVGERQPYPGMVLTARGYPYEPTSQHLAK